MRGTPKYCEKHADEEGSDRSQTWKRNDARRGSSSERGYTSEWAKARASFLARCPVCTDPYDIHVGEVRTANEVDHIIPVSTRPDLFWDQSNWQGLCRDCHQWKTRQEMRNKPLPIEGRAARHA